MSMKYAESGITKTRHSRWGECRYLLKGLLARHNHLDAKGVKRISFQTIRERSNSG